MKMPFPLRSRELLPEEITSEISCIRRLLFMSVHRIMKLPMRQCRSTVSCSQMTRMHRKNGRFYPQGYKDIAGQIG